MRSAHPIKKRSFHKNDYQEPQLLKKTADPLRASARVTLKIHLKPRHDPMRTNQIIPSLLGLDVLMELFLGNNLPI